MNLNVLAGLAWQRALKKKSKIRSINWYDINGRKRCQRWWICHAVNWYAKDNNKYMETYDKMKNIIS